MRAFRDVINAFDTQSPGQGHRRRGSPLHRRPRRTRRHARPCTWHDHTCSRYASPTGSDSWPGTESKPFATVQYLVDHLSEGETGCLFGGSYVGNLRTERRAG